MPVTIDVPGLGPVSIPDNIPSEKAEDYVRQVAQQRGVKLDLPAPAPAPAPSKSYGIGSIARDIGVSAAGIVPGLIETAAEFTPTDRALQAIGVQKGISSLAPETEIGKDIGKYGVLRGGAKYLRDIQKELYSEQAKAAQKEYERKLAEQEGFFAEAGTALKETLTTPELLTSQLPESLLSMIGGRGVAKVGEKVLKGVTPEIAKESGEKVAAKAAEKLGAERVAKLQKLSGGPETIRTVAGGAAMQGASVANQNFIATMDMPQEKLAATPEYQEAIKSGLSPEEARLSVARSAANGALLPATAISVVAQYAVPGGTSFERLFAGATERTLGADTAIEVAKQIGKSTLGETGSEAVEEGGGQFIANVFAPGQEDLLQGVGAAAGAAGAMGALMGGGAGSIHALQAKRAQQVIEERKRQEEQARQELDARMPPVQQIESAELTQLPPEQIRTEAQSFASAVQPGSVFTLDDILNNTGDSVAASQDAIAVANDLLNRGEVIQQPGETLSFRRVNDDERVIPLGNPDESYVYTVPTTRQSTEEPEGYTVESANLGVSRRVKTQEEAEAIKNVLAERAKIEAADLEEKIKNIRAQQQQIQQQYADAYANGNVTEEQFNQLATAYQDLTARGNEQIAQLEQQREKVLTEPTVTPIARTESGHEVRLHIPGQPARVLNPFATEQEVHDAIIDNAPMEQQRRIVEDPAYENVRNRLEQRAEEVDVEEAAPEPVEMTPEMQERVTQTANRMRSVLDQMGLQNIGLNVQQRLQEVVDGKLRAVDGYYLNRVIAASLEGSRDVAATIGHETIHALRELGMFSDKEWQTLTNRAKSEWIKKYRIRERYEGVQLSEEKVVEEAIADAFGDWLQGDLKERGLIAGLFNRIKLFMEKFGSVLRGQGFTTSSDIFKRARTGTLEGDRVERVAEGKQYALPSTINVDGKERPTTNSEGRPIHPTEEGVRNFWKWFGDSKAVDANGNPLVVYHGAKSDIERFEFKTKDFKNTYVTTDKNFPEWKILRGIYKQTGEDLLLARWHEYNTSGQFPELDNIISVQTASGEIESVKLNGRSAVSVVRSLVNNPRYVSERIAEGHRAFFFSEDPVYTGFYSVWGGRDYDRRPTTYPVYIKVEKPINKNSWSDFEPFYKKATKNNPQKMDLAKSAFLNERWEAMEAFPGLIEYAKQKGYDGYQLVEGGASAFGYSPVTEVAPGGVNTWAVFKPAQVKSAVGNRGAFSPTDKRIQYALPRTVNVDGVERPTTIRSPESLEVMQNEDFETFGVYASDGERIGKKFKTAEEARQFADSLSRPIHPTIEGVQNFWRWFGNSKIVNADGTPIVMYHGTARDIKEFKPKQANAIFVTQNPEFAEGFSTSSLGWMIKNATQVLDEETLKFAIDAGITEAVLEDVITNKYAKEWLKEREGFSLKNILRDALSSPMSDYISNRIQEELPSSENIVPLFIRSEKPFDYDKKEDRDALMAWAKSLDKNNPARQFIENNKNFLQEWQVIESPAVQSFLKEKGYDGFYVREGGNKNLAVYDPNQLKSAIGNTGAFSRDSGEIQYALPLSRQETDEIVKRARGDAELGRQMVALAAYMTPEERAKLTRATAVKMIDLLGTFPTAEEYAAVAYAGRAKRGWYENSAKAIVSVFGADAPRFAALLAALSPQCSVQDNLKNTLNLWKNWTAAGRPKDRATIMRIAGQSVQGTGTEESVLDAWKNNAYRALTTNNFTELVLSGPKVNSFYLNLIGVTEEVTNDTWMANFAFVDQKLFSGSLNSAGTEPGKGPGYLATNVVVRQAAERLTELTGQKWTPAEVQETVWSWAKALYEGAEAENISPIQFLTEGKLTDELINSVPDFSTLFFDENYESILRSAGYGQQLDQLVQQRNANRAELSDKEQGLATETAPFAPTTQKELERAAAERLTALEELRHKESLLERVFKDKPMAVFEARPSESLAEVVPALRSGNRKLIEKFTKGAKAILFDSDGSDRIAALLGFDSKLKRRIGSGGFEGKISANYQAQVPEEYANAYSAAMGYVLLQDAVPWQKPDPNGWGFGMAITIPKLNDEIEAEFFERLESLTGEGHTRTGNTILTGNFGGLENERFEEIILQIANEIGVKHGIRTRITGYRFDGGYLSNNVEDENGESVNAWKTKGTGDGYLRGDGSEKLVAIQEQLDALQAEFRDYCRAFQEEQDRKVKRGKKEGQQFALPQNVLGQNATLPTWTNPTDSKVDNVLYRLQDKMIDLKRVIETITKAAGNLADRWNPYLQEELYHGRTAQQTERFLRTEVRPLLQDLNRSNISIAELEEYLHNRHAEERNNQIASINPNLPDGGSGINTQQARNYLNALPQARRMTLERLARRVDDINKATRQILVKSGLETPQTVAMWEQTYPNYVPLFREDADYVTSSGYGVGQGFDVRGAFAKRATGSTRNVVDIFANVVMQRERAIIRAEKNRVAQALYGLAVQNPNKQFWLPIDPEGVKDPAQLQADLVSMGINPSDIANIFQQPTQPRPDPRTGLVTNKLDPFVLHSNNVMAVRINGRNHYVMFNNNDPRALRMVESIKNLDADQLGRALSMVGKLTRFIASVNTQYNPIFGIVNLFRDVQGAVLNLSTTQIADKVKDVMSATNLSGAMKGIWSTARAERSGGALPTSQWAKLWQELQEEGGQTGFRSQFSTSQERAEALEREIQDINAGKAKRSFFAMRDLLSDYNTSMENAVRLSAYKAALDKGLSKQQAASIAKNITVNFNRKGQVATQMGALYAFFNASVQGTARIAETLTKGRNPNASPYSLERYFGPRGQMIVGGALMVGALQAMMLAAAGFDDDEPPEFIKERNLVIPTGILTGKKDYITIPMPLGFNFIPNISRHMTEFWISGFKNPAKHVADLSGSAFEVFNPIGSAGWSAQTLTPTVLDPYIAIRENKDSFGRPIYKEDMSSLDPTPGYQRAKDTASSWSKGISVFLNAASGGTKYKPGFISPSPDTLDYLFGQIGGGVYREISKTEQTLTGIAKGEEVPTYKMPLVGRFYGNADDNAVQSQRYYENITRLNEHENEIKGRIKAREPIQDYLRENPEARLFEMGNKIEYRIRQLKQRRELMKDAGASDETIKKVNDQIVILMKRLNEQVAKMED